MEQIAKIAAGAANSKLAEKNLYSHSSEMQPTKMDEALSSLNFSAFACTTLKVRGGPLARRPSCRRPRLGRDVSKLRLVHARGFGAEDALDFVRRLIRANTPRAIALSTPPTRNFPNAITTVAPLTKPKATALSRRFKPPSTTFPVRDFDQNHDIMISNAQSKWCAACSTSNSMQGAV